MSQDFAEKAWEGEALEVLAELSWRPLKGSQISPSARDESHTYDGLPVYEHLREQHDTLEIPGQLRAAISRLNPSLNLTPEQTNQVARDVLTAHSTDAQAENQEAHRYLTRGYKNLPVTRQDGSTYYPTIRLISRNPDENTWLAVQQVTLKNSENERRFDIVLYCNGLPVGVIELKRSGDRSADLRGAHHQISLYTQEFPAAFRFNALTIISDGITARYGTPFTPYTHMAVWNVDEDGQPADLLHSSEDDDPLELRFAQDVLLFGVANQERFLDLLHNYTVFQTEADPSGGTRTVKKIAKAHQYFAVSKAVGSTLDAVRGNQQIGVVWHTQGSGKSLEMVFYNNIVMRHSQLGNPTTVLITDRTDLDDQLYNTFASTVNFLPEEPQEINSIAELRRELQGKQQGGIYFTTLQKFRKTTEETNAGAAHQTLSERSNIIVIVDEAHRSHYDNIDGYARHLRDALPGASFIAFTGTPIESLATGSTRATFGDYIDIYDLTRAVADGATVPVRYESRYIPLALEGAEDLEAIDREASRLVEGLDEAERRKVEQAALKMTTMYGAPDRLVKLAADLVDHWEKRRSAMKPLLGGPGKGMIVASTRQICADLYDQIIALRPDWAGHDITDGKVQVLYTGNASDAPDLARFARNNQASQTIQKRLKDPADDLELVIVQGMLLTGFDAPALHTLYLDRPLKGALLMQTLARINRTYRGKEEGLLVGYAPLIDNLKDALKDYASGDGTGGPNEHDMQTAAEQALDLIGEIQNLLEPVTGWKEQLMAKTPPPSRGVSGQGGSGQSGSGRRSGALQALRMVLAYLLRNRQAPEPRTVETADGHTRTVIEKSIYTKFVERSSRLSNLFNLVATHTGNHMVDRLLAQKNYVQFFEEVRVSAAKALAEERIAQGKPVPEDVKQLLENYTEGLIETGEIKDLHELAGIDRPDLNNFNLDILKEAGRQGNETLAIEVLRRAIQKATRDQVGKNQVRRAYYSEKLEKLINQYNNAQLSFTEIMDHVVAFSQELKEEASRREALGLDDDEMIFYDTLEACDRAELEYSTDALAEIARGIAQAIRGSSENWLTRPDRRAKLRTVVKRLLRKYKYPPAGQDEARRRVLEQMEIVAKERSAHSTD